MSVHQLCTNVHFRPLLNHYLLNVPEIFQTSNNINNHGWAKISALLKVQASCNIHDAVKPTSSEPRIGELTWQLISDHIACQLLANVGSGNARVCSCCKCPDDIHFWQASHEYLATAARRNVGSLTKMEKHMEQTYQTIQTQKPRNPETQPDLKGLAYLCICSFASLRLQTFSSLPAKNTEQLSPERTICSSSGLRAGKSLKFGQAESPSVKIADFCDLSLRIESSNIKLYLKSISEYLNIKLYLMYLILSYVVVATRSLAFELTGLADSQSDLNRLSNSLLGQKPHTVPSKNSLLASADPCFQHHPRAQKNMPLVG